MNTKAILAATAAVLFTGTASAETIFGLTTTQAIVTFDSASPGTVSAPIGLTGQLSGHTVRSIDFRPNTTGGATMYAISADAANTTAQVYSVNFATGALTPLGTTFTLTGNTSQYISIDFNPAADRLRIVTGSGQSFRWNPVTSAFVQADTALTYAAGQGSGVPFVAGVAYDQNANGTPVTTLFGFDLNTNNLVRIGGQGGVPSPNGGLVSNIGATGITPFDGNIGFDVGTFLGNAYISAHTGVTTDTLYSINLATGVASSLGVLGGTGFGIVDITVTAVPEPSTVLAGIAAVGGVALQIRRRRQAAKADQA
ncbi:MAG: DUF4394 domain-containing protein [Verrucomicrobia bacterium]|nr:DUF4394 domain-containing protein [Verrucomicrobiota bacterium]